ncbi:MAG: ribosome small subunit-dependent GTPase A [Clostridia bacterium]|nr:ribosome small subunit-dependent GTPase A [Clostridia bacterium]
MPEIIKARILTCTGGLYLVETPEETIWCRARGVFRNDGITPVPGDYVTLKTDGKDSYSINDVKKRKNLLLRPPVANLDRLFVVCAVCDPMPSLLNTDKVLSAAVYNGIEPVLVFTKTDLDPGEGKKLCSVYQKAGFKAVCLSSLDPKDASDKLIPLIGGFSSAFTGASGVGKSSLIKALFPQFVLEIGELSRKISRGKNTTRQSIFYNASELTGIPGTYLADTPGFSMLDYSKFRFFDIDELVFTFPEFADFLGKCRYTKCSHTKEEGCEILRAVSEGKISPSRHESYLRIREEISRFKKYK